MGAHADTNQDEAVVHFYCELCKLWHIDSDDKPVAHCCHCNRPLCPMYDYGCVSCGRLFCDEACQACQEDDCDIITCIDCVARHLANSHSQAAVAL